jgi:aminopeptidase N
MRARSTSSLVSRVPPLASVALCALLGLSALPFSSPAQTERPVDFRRDLARQKAGRFAGLHAATVSQTENQTQYDVTHYDIDLTIDHVAQTVAGAVTITGMVLSSTLDEVDLDLASTLTVSRVDGESAPLLSFTHASDLLTVTLPSSLYQGETFSLTVQYSGPPDYSYGAFGFDSFGGLPMIWSLSEPFGARSWWPCKDVPSDKANSVDLHITVDPSLIVASNGTLVGVVNNATTKTYNWHEGYPISTYLVSVAIHPYTTFSDWYRYSPADSMEVQFYVYPSHYTTVQATYALTVDMIAAFAELFGEYPFLDEKYGHAEFTWGGGMEHQTITSLGGWSEYLIAHELSHQWWGDMITCDDFHHIWLNEGFATYAEALWSEYRYGMARYHSDMKAAAYFGPGTIYVDDTSDWNRIFDAGLSYNKGSWVLHMLRHVVGDSTFFHILKTYYADTRYQYDTATTEEFRDLCEVESGMDLDFFFHQWIYEEYAPTYIYQWSADNVGGLYHVNLSIDQAQSNYIFTMPIDITIETAAGETTLVVWDSQPSQQFSLVVEDAPLALDLDRDNWILKTVEKQIVQPTFDRGILLVNGVDFVTYGSEIRTAYEDSVFSGTLGFAFWDCLDEGASGYPAALPPPLGHGAVPADTLKQFSTVIWVGNNYNGDLASWTDTPVYSYLAAGGNVLLMTRQGQSFIGEPLRDYLGISWRESASNTIGNCISAYPDPGLQSMDRIGTQSICAVFDTSLATSESKLLFKDTISFSTHRGLGVWKKPADGGAYRRGGGQFVFLSGRPYRWDHGDLRTDTNYILRYLLDEPFDLTGAIDDGSPLPFTLYQNYPNPFNPATTIRFSVPAKSHVTIRVFDVTGSLVKTLLSRNMDRGTYPVSWDGTNNAGEAVASGVYFYRLTAGLYRDQKKMVLIR